MKLLKKQLSKRKTKKKESGHDKDNSSVYGKSHQYFLPQARLNLGQRRYCHCLMKSRKSTGQPYAFCTNIAKQDWEKAKKMRVKSKSKQYYFDIMKTNCVMNYDYDDYSLEEIQAFAQEKNIPLFSTTTPGGVKKYYSKNKLVQLLVQNYLKKHNSQKSRKKYKSITK
jgi:predicted TIM-barrel fold metal-dependent hydrolase